MDWEIITQILLLLGAGIFAIGSSIIVAEDKQKKKVKNYMDNFCLLYTSPSPRD